MVVSSCNIYWVNVHYQDKKNVKKIMLLSILRKNPKSSGEDCYQ